MTRSTLIRAGAGAAILGGALRAPASFAPALIASDLRRELLYVAIDVCLAAGVTAVYLQRSDRLGRSGTAGFALALIGIAIVRAHPLLSTLDLYPIGALAIACGVIVLTASGWREGTLRGFVPGMFFVSTVLGIAGTIVHGATALFVCSGVLFGMALAGLGIETAVATLSARHRNATGIE